VKFNYQLQEEHESSSNHFIKLKDGESVRGIFRGDPFEFKQHWLETEQKSFNCQGDKCPECAKGNRPKFRFRINFVVRDQDKNYVAKIFEHGSKFYKALKGLHEGGYDLERNIMSVTRQGKGTLTTYSILPVPNGAISEIVDKAISAVKLNDLSNTKPERDPGEDADDFSNIGDIPF
jgi:hypothetical protein